MGTWVFFMVTNSYMCGASYIADDAYIRNGSGTMRADLQYFIAVEQSIWFNSKYFVHHMFKKISNWIFNKVPIKVVAGFIKTLIYKNKIRKLYLNSVFE
jgi:hypothetical protein